MRKRNIYIPKYNFKDVYWNLGNSFIRAIYTIYGDDKSRFILEDHTTYILCKIREKNKIEIIKAKSNGEIIEVLKTVKFKKHKNKKNYYKYKNKSQNPINIFLFN